MFAKHYYFDTLEYYQHVIFLRRCIFQGTPSGASQISIPLLFAPLLLLQGAGVLYAAYRLIEKIVLLVRSGVVSERYLVITSKVRDYFGFLRHGSR